MRRRTFLEALPGFAFAAALDVRAAPQLQQLREVEDLKKLFNAAKGQPRIVLLLSPT